MNVSTGRQDSDAPSDALEVALEIPGSVGDELVYAIGDVHGCYALLQSLLKQIVEDAQDRRSGKRAILIFCGDYIDRGPDSAKVLSALVWLKAHSDFDLHLLKGNHEEAMLAFIDRPTMARDWLTFGGVETLSSYGVNAPDFDDLDARQWQARNELLDRMPASHLRLLESLELAVQVGDYAFVHAGVRPGTKLEKQQAHDLLWIRDEFLAHEGRHEKIIVHGHSFTSGNPNVTPWRIGIDTGAYETGILTALRLQDEQHGFLQATS